MPGDAKWVPLIGNNFSLFSKWQCPFVNNFFLCREWSFCWEGGLIAGGCLYFVVGSLCWAGSRRIPRIWEFTYVAVQLLKRRLFHLVGAATENDRSFSGTSFSVTWSKQSHLFWFSLASWSSWRLSPRSPLFFLSEKPWRVRPSARCTYCYDLKGTVSFVLWATGWLMGASILCVIYDAIVINMRNAIYHC